MERNSHALTIDRCDTIADIVLYYKHLYKEITREDYHFDYEEDGDLSAFNPSLDLDDTQSIPRECSST